MKGFVHSSAIRTSVDCIKRFCQLDGLLSAPLNPIIVTQVFFILEGQPGISGRNYCKQHLPISMLFAFSVKTLQKK